ncbi:MAG: alpha-glucosidase C-terminal domain-containing protein, partial [Bacteroidetes bacterium]|nr:alpha-glucosidase C-terminal domain-containing protein [Bacteroidota bacterium]
VEEQLNSSGSLLNFYRRLLRLREDSKALQTGELVFVDSNNDQVLSFFRVQDKAQVLVCLNLSDQFQNLKIEEERSATSNLDFITGKEVLIDSMGFSLAPWQAMVLDW